MSGRLNPISSEDCPGKRIYVLEHPQVRYFAVNCGHIYSCKEPVVNLATFKHALGLESCITCNKQIKEVSLMKDFHKLVTGINPNERVSKDLKGGISAYITNLYSKRLN